jgi:TatD DNase family protein
VIDCHSHLALPQFDGDRTDVIQRAAAAGVERILLVAEDLDDGRRVLAVAATHAAFVPCLGLHPDRFAEDRPAPGSSAIEAVCAQIVEHRQRLAAIGEVGLDHWLVQDAERRRAQAAALERFVELSATTGLPLNVHSRSAARVTLELLLRWGARNVLLHAFDGKAGHAAPGVDAGYVFSIPPSLVRSAQKRRLVRYLPLEAIALESDSPALGPDPGVRNEPANLRTTVRAIAAIHQVSDDRVIEATDAAARRLFGPL